MNTSKLLLVMLIAIGLLGLTAVLSAQEREVSVADFPNQTRILNNSDFGFEVEFKVGDLKLNEIKTKNGVYDELSIANYGFTSRLGEPKLPVLSKLIAVPVGATVSFDVLSRTHQTLSQTQAQLAHQIIPAQRSISKSEDPSLVPFAVNDAVYGQDAFTDNKLFTIEEVGFMRGVRVFQIYFEPVRYNPVSGEIIVSNDVTIRVNFNNPDFAATEELLAKTASYEFDRVYPRTIFNWRNDQRPSLMRYPTKYLILCPPNYTTTLQPFVDWKRQQGYNVIVTTVGTGGTVTNSTSAIISYMQGVWNSATTEDPAPSYLLIVGDTSTSGNNIIANTGAAGSHVTDLTYVRLNGTDYIPEMYYGRFSVSSATELTNIINKTVTFEKTQMPDLSYLGKVVMIAGADASYAPTYGNGQINYGTTHYFNTTNGITSDTYLYPASQTSDALIIANANEGRGYMNYTAHGSETSWADPTFTVTNVNAMTNSGKYGVMVGNCCVTNAFNYSSPCFGEAIIRKADGGGVAYIGGTNNTYWDEDYWWGIGYKTPIQAAAHPYSATTLGAYDAMFHTHSEAFTDWAQTVGETNFMGNSAVQQSTSTRKPYYWEIYSIMGDPSVMTYLKVPTANNASYSSTIFLGATTYSITGAAPYSRIGLTLNGVLYGAGITDAAGNLTMTITPFTTAGTAKLVITAQNRITVIADIIVAAASGPYMSVESAVWDDANNDVPDYNESGYLDVTFKNVGVEAATNVTATLTCSTPGITITDNNHFISSLAAGATVFANNAYAISIANNVANGTVANFTITMVGSATWTHDFNLTLNAPALAFSNMTISDPTGNNNGRLDPGETVTITMPLLNNGGATSQSGSATLTCSTPGITVNTGTANFSAITASGSSNLTFSITASSGMTIGTVASLVFNATAGAYTANKTETTAVGLIIETFETGNFNAYPWSFSGNANWTIDNTTAHNGTYSAKSGTIVANQSTTMQTVRILTTGGDVSFWYKVSSESGYDYLKFYVDGVQQGQWSGTVDWTQATYTLAVGTRTLAWTYSKDGSVDSGSDCAWVDDIIFPASANYTPANITWTPASLSQSLGANQTANQTLSIGNTGNEALNYTVSKPTGSSTVLNESFENGGSIPNGWTQTYVSGSTSWVFATGGYNNYHPSAAYDGTYNARLFYNSSAGATTKLITPVLNLSGADSATLTFYHTQEYWSPDQDELRVYYGTSVNGPWTQLTYYTSSIAAWTLETISLPSLSSSCYIAFEGIAKYGYGVCIDKVMVTKTSSVSIPWLTVNGGDSYSSSITAGGANQNVTIGFNSAGLSVGTYNSTLTIDSNSTANSSVNIPVALNVSSVAGPAISVNPGSLDFESIAVGSSDVKTFTIQNTGGETLTGSITTPAAYTVALASREAGLLTGSRSIGTRNTLAYSIDAGQSKTYNVTFAPAAAGTYNGNIVVTSNDPGNPSVNVSVTGSAYAPPTAILGTTTMETTLVTNHTEQTSFTICNTGSIDLNYSLSIPGSPAWLSCLPMSSTVSPSVCYWVYVNFDATGLNAGTYNAQIIVNSNDPANPSQAIDVTLNVQLTNVAEWVPVTYPNNSATVYGLVTVDWANCQTGDAVAAFVGTECRAAAEVTMNGDTAYVTLLVNLASAGETVSFKVYDYTADTIYPVLETHNLNFGQVIGSPTPVPINGVSSVALDAPVVSNTLSEGSVILGWEAVAGAGEYHIYRSLDPYGTYSQIGTTTALQYTDTAVFDQAFYYVKAVTNLAAARN